MNLLKKLNIQYHKLSSDGKVGLDIEKEVTLSFYIILNEIEYGPYNINILIDTKEHKNDHVYYNGIDESLRGDKLKQALRTSAFSFSNIIILPQDHFLILSFLFLFSSDSLLF